MMQDDYLRLFWILTIYVNEKCRFDKIGNTQVQFSTYNLIPTQRSPRWLGVSSLRPRADQSSAVGAFSLVDLMARDMVQLSFLSS